MERDMQSENKRHSMASSLPGYVEGENEIVTRIRQELTKVIDPEIGMDVVSLGLIYRIEVDDRGNAEVDMTLTSMGCPLGPQFQAMVKNGVESVPGVKQADVQIVFTPPWDPKTMASDDARILLGIF